MYHSHKILILATKYSQHGSEMLINTKNSQYHAYVAQMMNGAAVHRHEAGGMIHVYMAWMTNMVAEMMNMAAICRHKGWWYEWSMAHVYMAQTTNVVAGRMNVAAVHGHEGWGYEWSMNSCLHDTNDECSSWHGGKECHLTNY